MRSYLAGYLAPKPDAVHKRLNPSVKTPFGAASGKRYAQENLRREMPYAIWNSTIGRSAADLPKKPAV